MIAVLLASCGLVHALNVSTDGGGGEHAATPPRPSASASPSLSEEDDHDAAAPAAAVTRASAAAAPSAAAPAVSEDPETSERSLGASVWRILRQECAHVRALDRPDFVRLCQLLDLPLEL